KTWNYEHFLNELKEIITNSPPYTEDWSGLDGTWYNRYIYHAKYDPEVLLKFSDKDNKRRQMKSFFQDIILEREKRNAGKNYVIEGVKVLNEA
ncbi:225_t:CDS:2, partial [Ambispora leptoticha]